MTVVLSRAEYHEIAARVAKGRGRFPRASKERRTANGIPFDSLKEKKRYLDLRFREVGGLIRDLELQPQYEIKIEGKHYCYFTADFRYFDIETGQTIIEDVKSSGTAKDPAYRLRKRAAELYHGVTITEV